MAEILVVAGFALPPALLVAGLLLLGMAMPSARDTLERWSWTAPATFLLIVPASLALLFLLAWRGDGDASGWARGGADLHVLSVAALGLGGAALAVQWWVMVRADGALAPRTRSVGAAFAGVAMLGLFAALILAWLTGLR